VSSSLLFRLVCLSGAFALLFAVGAPFGPHTIAGAAPSEEEIELEVVQGKEFTNGVGMAMKRIPRGRFLMGSPQNEPGRSSQETQHEVTLTKDFFMSATEVTQGQWKKVMGNNPSANKGGDDFPVETVSWNDTQEFLKKLNARAEETSHGRIYRLPTEAEWEYACRGGVGKAFFTGDKLTSQQANVSEGKSLGRTCKTASYKPNAYGMHDMNGNVWEWCHDWYDANYYARSPKLDPRGPETGSQRVARGGSYAFDPSSCRSAHRAQGTPTERHGGLSFRVACDLRR
jgi:formylglycine-generating enzyme required for sulfatase activity